MRRISCRPFQIVAGSDGFFGTDRWCTRLGMTIIHFREIRSDLKSSDSGLQLGYVAPELRDLSINGGRKSTFILDGGMLGTAMSVRVV